MSERQSRRVRQETRRRFKTDFDDFTKMICSFSLRFRLWFCLELLFGKQYKRVKSMFRREKRGDK